MAFPSWRFWWFNIAVSMPFILAFAMFSWHFIEKPTLRLKERVKFLRESEAKWLARYPIRLAATSILLCYGLILLHWSHFDAATHFSLKTHWRYFAIGTPLLALLIAGRPDFSGLKKETVISTP
jgi:peptidoglycan/LPS O-acetylase OafA/YrhL